MLCYPAFVGASDGPGMQESLLLGAAAECKLSQDA